VIAPAVATGAIDAGARGDDMESALDLPVLLAETTRTRRRRIAIPVAAAIVALVAVGGVLLAQWDDSEPTIQVGNPEPSTGPAAVVNGWVAFDDGGEVLLVDTKTGAIRRLPDLRPSDLEWRPGTDQLTIAGDQGTNRAAETLSTPVTVYSVSTGELRRLGSVEAAHITWSPDGSTLAYHTGENGPQELWLVDASGANERLLAPVGEAIHGVGPVWSPTGGRIAYQRRFSGERHEVVLVNVADGRERVIAPPQTEGPDGPLTWYPQSVTWSPDGTTLLSMAWGIADQASGSSVDTGVIAVPADTPTNATVLADIGRGSYYSHRWFPIQMWGRQPG
jgi:hypothetical protein